MKKEILLDHSTIVYNRAIDDIYLEKDWNIYTGDWWTEKDWVYGKHRENSPGMIVSRASYNFNTMIEFEASTVLPSTHDINFMWNGSWDEKTNKRTIAYVAGLQGWWEGKVGIEKSPDYKLTAGTGLFNFEPGKIYFIQGGSIDGHIFIFVDGKLLLEITDPEPIDYLKYGRVGFEAYCSYIKIRNIKIRKIEWKARELSYTPEF